MQLKGEFTFDPAAFKGMECAGWQQAAASYDELLGSVTRQAMLPLLDATFVQAGIDILEVCCGLGYGVGAALARGARPAGVDFAAAMIKEAADRYPAARFQHGDAEDLRFADESFDAEICAFDVDHLPNPEKAIVEAHRVLRRGGRYGSTMWCTPGKSKFHGLVLESIRVHGTFEVPLPPAPPPFRYSDPEMCVEALREDGIVKPSVSEIDLAFCPTTPQRVLDLTYSAVRLKRVLSLQTEHARQQIHRAIIEGVERFREGGRISIPMPAVLAGGEKSK